MQSYKLLEKNEFSSPLQCLKEDCVDLSLHEDVVVTLIITLVVTEGPNRQKSSFLSSLERDLVGNVSSATATFHHQTSSVKMSRFVKWGKRFLRRQRSRLFLQTMANRKVKEDLIILEKLSEESLKEVLLSNRNDRDLSVSTLSIILKTVASWPRINLPSSIKESLFPNNDISNLTNEPKNEPKTDNKTDNTIVSIVMCVSYRAISKIVTTLEILFSENVFFLFHEHLNYRICQEERARKGDYPEQKPVGSHATSLSHWSKNGAEKFFKYHNKISGKLMNSFIYKFFIYLKYFKYLRTHIRKHIRTCIQIDIQ
jgi:hypothetical protein